jgi:hypothetical protein
MLITAERAHGADGKEIETSLAVTAADTVTLTAQHRVGGVVYPVLTGAGFEVGYSTAIFIPPPPSAVTLAQKEALELRALSTLIVGAPEPVPASEAGGATSSGVAEQRRAFARSVCGHNFEWYEEQEGIEAQAYGKNMCGNAFVPGTGKSIVWRGTMKGMFMYRPEIEVRHNNARDCTKDTPDVSQISDYAVKDAYQCHYGPKTSDGNGGASASGGHYLRAQAHWELGHRGRCREISGPIECPGGPSSNPWVWEDKPLELHLWPSGMVDMTVGD